MSTDKLKPYRDKRDFRRTPEPRGTTGRAGDRRIFVIQKHDASRLHYDFRLEIGETLKSWAVPKGPSTDPRQKRLAVETEDHPLDYADFEGAIAQDQYGGGTVMVWDAGSYRNLKVNAAGEEQVSMQDAYDNGRLTVWLEGKKLAGGYALTRFRKQGGKSQWLLVKMDDDKADARRNPISTEYRSVLTRRTMKEIADDDA